MKAVTAQEMREIDRRAMADFKIPGVVLMENAGLRVVEAVVEKLSGARGRTVTIFAGKGNNGGDGLVAARHLFNMGADVKVLLLDSPDNISGDAAVNLEIWRRMGQKVFTITQKDDFNAVRLFLVRTDIIVDAIYGTGFKGKVRELAGRVIEAVNDCGKPVIAVDVPSGVEADTGFVNGPCIRASLTVTFGLPKVGILLEPGASYAGDLRVVDISLPASLLDDERLKCNLIDMSLVKGWLPKRPVSSHKGDYGRVLVIGGSRGMAGAACLTAEAAARTGAGLITLAVPEGIYEPVASKLTEVMVMPVPQTGEGTLSREALSVIGGMLERADVLALGPGLSTNPETVEAVREIVSLSRIPTVLDADGLNAFMGHTDLFKKVKKPLVLTPHPGEMARLAGLSVNEVQLNRLDAARSWSSTWNAVLALKGARSIIALPDGTTYINPTGNPGMATGGSGDVLTGIIAGLVAQGMEAAKAAAAGVYLHGLAGDTAARDTGMMGLLAGDILRALPAVTRSLESCIRGVHA
ncbi:MAG: NAD(P)H-hydrate dehydratase [Peptococcaceae bacterium]|nr:NAD(P)H-hydrate dehydratase [Peptococcaceae bacterium]